MQHFILVITALPLEFKAVRSFLNDVKSVTDPETGSIYNDGLYEKNGLRCRVAVVEAGQGNINATHETERALAFFKPSYLFFVGIAGGLKDVALGDVVASSKVIGYESGKVEELFKPRFDSPQPSYRLEQMARHVSREEAWLNRVPGQLRTPQSFVAPIAAGEKVVASTRSTVYTQLRELCSDALAVEMEGAGFLQALRPRKAEGIVVRGISDLIDKKGEADATGSQPLAATNAAAFAFEMIAQLLKQEPPQTTSPSANPKAINSSILKLLVELYPQGPEENQIWKRAGGDVAVLVNSASRRSQWHSAIEKLSHGGGGSITFLTLLEEVNGDFPRNTEVTSLLKSLTNQ